MLPTIELAIIVFTSLDGRAPSMSGEEAITKWTPGALRPVSRLVGSRGPYPLRSCFVQTVGNPRVFGVVRDLLAAFQSVRGVALASARIAPANSSVSAK